jgi:hypothetical protein
MPERVISETPQVMFQSGHNSAAVSRAAAAEVDQIGVYLTDEVFLYRVADVLMTESGEVADIEDCYGMDIVRVRMCDLLARRLRVVPSG